VLTLDTVKAPFLTELAPVDRLMNRTLGRASYAAIFDLIAETAQVTAQAVEDAVKPVVASPAARRRRTTATGGHRAATACPADTGCRSRGGALGLGQSALGGCGCVCRRCLPSEGLGLVARPCGRGPVGVGLGALRSGQGGLCAGHVVEGGAEGNHRLLVRHGDVHAAEAERARAPHRRLQLVGRHRKRDEDAVEAGGREGGQRRRDQSGQLRRGQPDGAL
jgi:hypothetical protein